VSEPKLALITDSNWGGQAVYFDGKLLVDLGDNCNRTHDMGYETLDFLLEQLAEKLDIGYESLSGMESARKIQGFDWTDYEGYWPEDIGDVGIQDEHGEVRAYREGQGV
jgi:hypothetical protein